MVTRALAGAVVAGILAGGYASPGIVHQTTPTPRTTSSTTSATDRVASAARASTRNHYIANLHGSVAPRRLGFNLFDTGASGDEIRALPTGVRALVWLGQKCPTPADAAFKRTVRRLAGNSRVFGYYLSDEPHISDCPHGPAALLTRTKYIRQVSAGRQRSFIVLAKHGGYADYTAFRPQVTGVSMIGLDAYPCNRTEATCVYSKINERVNAALSRRIARARIVPVYQAFGQGYTSDPYYRMPSRTELARILNRWRSLLPDPPMDYTYSWGHQSSANPTLRDRPGLQRVLQSYFLG